MIRIQLNKGNIDMHTSNRMISCTDYRGVTSEFTREAYLAEWDEANLLSVKSLIAYAKEFNCSHSDRLTEIERQLRELTIEAVNANFDARSTKGK